MSRFAQNPGYMQGSLTAHRVARTDVLLVMQEGVQNGHTATSSAVYTPSCSLFSIAEQESAGISWQNREKCTAAQCTQIPSAMPS